MTGYTRIDVIEALLDGRFVSSAERSHAMTEDEFQEMMAKRRKEREDIYNRSIQAPKIIIDWTEDPVKVDDFHESRGIPKDELRAMAVKIELVDPLKDDRGKWVKDAIVTVTLTSKEKS